MPRMTPKEFAYWTEQVLPHAHRVWQANGLASGAWSGTKAQKENALWRYIRAYRGDQWEEDWMGLDLDELAITPSFFSAVNTFEAQLMARTPEAQVIPRRATPEASEAARVVSALLDYDIYELKLKRQWNKALRDSFFAPAGIVRHGFTPDVELRDDDGNLLDYFAGIRPEKPWMRRWKIWDFRCTPLAESLHSDGDAWWCAFRTLYTVDQIKKNRNLITRDDLRPTISLEVRNHTGEVLRTDPEVSEFVEVWTVYDKRERKWFQVTEGSDKPLREPEEWPISWEDLPYDALFFNEQMDSIFPEPFAHAVWPSVVERNKVRTLTIELVKRMRNLVLLNQDALAEGQAELIEMSDLTEIILTKGGNLKDAIAQVGLGGFHPELLALDSLYQQDIRETIGQSQMDRAQRINVESAQEAAGVQAGAAIHAGRNIEAVEDFLSSSIRHYAQARQETTSEDQVIPIVGRRDAMALRSGDARYFKVSADQIHQEFDFRVRAGSSLPDTQENEMKKALADLQIAAQAPDLHDMQEVFSRYWRARGEDPSKVMLNAKQLAATTPAGPAIPGEEPAQQQPQDQSQLIAALSNMGGRVQ